MVKKSKEYTLKDHVNREFDLYAKYKYDLTIKYLVQNGLKKNQKVLNIGCGAADFNLQIHEVGFQCDGFDEDRFAIKIGKVKNKKFDSKLLVSSLKNATLKFDGYTYFVCHDVLEHIEDDKSAIKYLNKLIQKKNSLLVVTVPAFDILYGVHDENLGHYRRYTIKKITDLFKEDYDIKKIHYVGTLGFLISLIFSKIFRVKYPKQNQHILGIVIAMNKIFDKIFFYSFGSSLIMVCRRK